MLGELVKPAKVQLVLGLGRLNVLKNPGRKVETTSLLKKINALIRDHLAGIIVFLKDRVLRDERGRWNFLKI